MRTAAAEDVWVANSFTLGYEEVDQTGCRPRLAEAGGSTG
jgi:hypothetical protein